MAYPSWAGAIDPILAHPVTNISFRVGRAQCCFPETMNPKNLLLTGILMFVSKEMPSLSISESSISLVDKESTSIAVPARLTRSSIRSPYALLSTLQDGHKKCEELHPKTSSWIQTRKCMQIQTILRLSRTKESFSVNQKIQELN